ncbi:MAG: exo-alpha-sialidase [Armatimonadetes bacterium]|nr:exo-alpha-sialidase [Armatimonadota bacterium]
MIPVVLAMSAVVPISNDVFVSGTLRPREPFSIYRIPALVQISDGALLAFCEGRKDIGDQSANVIVVKKREKGYTRWSNLKVVAEDPPASLNNPCVLVDGTQIFLMYQRYPAGKSEWNVSAGMGPESCQSFLITSNDSGENWSSPRDLTPWVKPQQARSVASGPGIGIKTSGGRLIFPFNTRIGASWTTFCVYSDDHGKTWQKGELVQHELEFNPNEVQIAEISAGKLLMNARNQAKGHFRLQSTSSDGGRTWTRIEPKPDLIDPVCMGSLLRLSDGRLAFSNPRSTPARAQGTVQLSGDDGATWRIAAEFGPDSFEYSSLCELAPGVLGVLYETKEKIATGAQGYRIRFAEIRLLEN